MMIHQAINLVRPFHEAVVASAAGDINKAEQELERYSHEMPGWGPLLLCCEIWRIITEKIKECDFGNTVLRELTPRSRAKILSNRPGELTAYKVWEFFSTWVKNRKFDKAFLDACPSSFKIEAMRKCESTIIPKAFEASLVDDPEAVCTLYHKVWEVVQDKLNEASFGEITYKQLTPQSRAKMQKDCALGQMYKKVREFFSQWIKDPQFGQQAFHSEDLPSTFKLEAISRFEAETGTLVHRWIVDSKQIKLVKKGEGLELSTFNLATKKREFPGKATDSPFPSEKPAISIVVLGILSDLFPFMEPPTIDSNGELDLKGTVGVVKEWTWDDKRVSLLQKPQGMVWQLFNSTMKTTSRLSFYSTGFYNLWGGSHDYTFSVISTEVRGKLAECTIQDMLINNSRLQSITLIPPAYPSRFDTSKIIDKERSAITLLDIDFSNWSGHAVIIIETMEAGNHCAQIAHFGTREITDGSCSWFRSTFDVFRGEVRYHPLDESLRWKYQWKAKSETWLVTKSALTDMVALIEYDIDRQRNNLPLYFNFRGSDAIRADREHNPNNCITWARNKVKFAGIKLEPAYSGHLATLPRDYMK